MIINDWNGKLRPNNDCNYDEKLKVTDPFQKVDCLVYQHYAMDPDEELPELDYIPVTRERIEVYPGSSSSTEGQGSKRPRALTPAERKRKSRAAKSAAQKEEELAKRRTGMARKRANQTEEERDTARSEARMGMARNRTNQTEEDRENAQSRNRNEQATHRANQTEEEMDNARS